MQADYSGFANAGMIQGQALANMGAQIGDVIKQRGEEEKFIKKSEQVAKSIGELIPELKPQADEALAALASPDLSRRDRLAVAESITERLNIGLTGMAGRRQDRRLDLSERELDMKAEMMAAQIAALQNPELRPKDLQKSSIVVDGKEVPGVFDKSTGNFTDYEGNTYDPFTGEKIGKPKMDKKSDSLFKNLTESLKSLFDGKDGDGSPSFGKELDGDTSFEKNLETKEKAFKEIAKLRIQGRDEEALAKLNALNVGGLLFKVSTMEDLKNMFPNPDEITLPQPGNPSAPAGMVLPPRDRPSLYNQ